MSTEDEAILDIDSATDVPRGHYVIDPNDGLFTLPTGVKLKNGWRLATHDDLKARASTPSELPPVPIVEGDPIAPPENPPAA